MANDGGPAFPRQSVVADANDNSFKLGHPGMSLRDWFAGQALAGSMGTAHGLGHLTSLERRELFAKMASIIYEIADSMIKERERWWSHKDDVTPP